MRLFAVFIIASALISCSDGDGHDLQASGSANTSHSPEPTPLVIYCGRSEALIGKTLVAFDEIHPDIKLDIRYNRTPTLASQSMAEKEQCPAEVFWFQDSGYLGALAKSGMLERLPEYLYERVDPRFRDPGQQWVGITGRLRVLVYNTDAVTEAELPGSLKDLMDPKWKGRIGWAPGNASFQAHVSVLRHQWGEDRTRAWLLAVKANEPKMFPKNSPQVQAAHRGDISIGWVNHYYLHKLKTEGYKAANYSFPSSDGDNVLMVAGAAMRKGVAGKPRESAEKLLAYLLSDTVQGLLAQETFEYPVVQDAQTHPDVEPLASIALAEVDQAHLTDIGPTLNMLRDLDLQ